MKYKLLNIATEEVCSIPATEFGLDTLQEKNDLIHANVHWVKSRYMYNFSNNLFQPTSKGLWIIHMQSFRKTQPWFPRTIV